MDGSLNATRARCALCEGVCPECGGDVGEAAGSAGWILCSSCHATFPHRHDDGPLFLKVDCLSLPVPDLDAALAFYSGDLGHEVIWRTDTAAGLRLPDSNAELVLHTDDRPMETDLAVASVPEAVERFTLAGGELLAGPFEIQIGLCAVVADPWGNVLVLLDTSRGLFEVDADKRVVGNLG